MEKTKLVVLNNHTLGFIDPEFSKLVQILHTSILKGSPYSDSIGSITINNNDKIRLASENDFNNFRCVFGSFSDNTKYEYSK